MEKETKKTQLEEPVSRLTRIKDWALTDRPREKLLEKGQAALSDAELLAIILGSGSANESAVDLGKRILASVENNLVELSRLGIPELKRFKGVGEAKAINILAALELGRRRRQSESLERKSITSSRDVFEIMHPLLADQIFEEFWIITLTRANKVKSTFRISEGGVSGTVADPKKIFKKALDDNASALIICHNHPSGTNRPSDSDKEITKKCVEAGRFLDLPLLDHVIIAQDSFFSFADEGLIG
jgi:DNA repair protein RadC